MNEDLKKHLDTAFAFLSRINVKGDDVDYMAMARQELRAAWAILGKKPETKAENSEKTDTR